MNLIKKESLRIAVQKSGRLTDKSVQLLRDCDLKFDPKSDFLLENEPHFPSQLLRVRNTDIPTYLADGLCDLAIIGKNTLIERSFEIPTDFVGTEIPLPFGGCRLSLAIPKDETFTDLSWFRGKRIATSYPNTVEDFFNKEGINVATIEIQGSVEIAPELGSADAIADLVSTGLTLERHKLKEVYTILKSQSVLVARKDLDPVKKQKFEDLLLRIRGVIAATERKYIMLNAPVANLKSICELLPGLESPSIMPLQGNSERVAVHAVAEEKNFWITLEKLKTLGATSILVLPIEKMLA